MSWDTISTTTIIVNTAYYCILISSPIFGLIAVIVSTVLLLL